MRNLVSAIVAVSLVSTTLAYAGETLAPGKPAGVHKAQGMGSTEWLLFGGAAVIAVGVGISVAGGRSSPGGTQPAAVVQATSTT